MSFETNSGSLPDSDPNDESDVSIDLVRARRKTFERFSSIGRRCGYALFGIAIVFFAIGFATGFPQRVGFTIEFCLLLGSILLAPSLVVGYAVKAAEREDRENGR
ncbi:MAG: hypothetical protein WCK41_08910 [Actinomycetes bacterium]